MPNPEEKESLTRNGMTFAAWLHRVDLLVLRVSGVSVHDLPDWNSWDTWDSGATPNEGARTALLEADFPFA